MVLFSFLSTVMANPDYEKGLKAFKLKEYKKSEEHFTTCIKIEPENASCYWELGWVYWVYKDWRAVIKNWKKAKEYNIKQEKYEHYYNIATKNLLKKDIIADFKIYFQSPGRVTVGDKNLKIYSTQEMRFESLGYDTGFDIIVELNESWYEMEPYLKKEIWLLSNCKEKINIRTVKCSMMQSAGETTTTCSAEVASIKKKLQQIECLQDLDGVALPKRLQKFFEPWE